jgi:type II secretory pathway component GspD/PulD (secretin)
MTLTQSRRTGARSLMAFAVCLLPLSLAAKAQDAPAGESASKPVNPCVAMRNAPTETRTFYLNSVTQQDDGREITNAIRNMLCPDTKVYQTTSQRAIIIEAPPSQLTLADKIIHDLDRAARTYRVTYTLTELDAGKTVSTQHFSMLLSDGERSTLKEGNKIPIATGTYANGVAASSPSSEIQTQFTYLDVGMNFDAALSVSGNSVHLHSKVEDSSLDQPVTIAGVTEPVVRQSVLDGTSVLTLDKPFMLGSIDIPNTARHMDIAVLIEQIK